MWEIPYLVRKAVKPRVKNNEIELSTNPGSMILNN